MERQKPYGKESFALAPGQLAEWSELSFWFSARALALIWLQIFLLVGAGVHFWGAAWFPFAYPFFLFLIAGRQGALLQMAHEAGHRLISKNARLNNAFAYWLCATPIGVNFFGYTRGHRRHHAHAGTKLDPPSDTEKYRVTDSREPAFYLVLLKDLSGLTALSTFFAYQNGVDEPEEAAEGQPSGPRHLLQLCALQLVILALFRFNLFHYLALWLYPAMGAHMFLMRVRGIAEHGLAKQKGISVETSPEGMLHTRSFLTPARTYGFPPLVWLEKALIGSLAVHYHHEHHLFPNVPFYNLKKVHAALSAEVARRNPHVFAPGYFSAAFRGPRD
jgi:fatty acid desaturase